MKHIKLMADYQCHPLWNMSPDKYGDIDPRQLPISEKLQLRLSSWAAVYDETLNLDDPRISGFVSENAERAFKSEGARLVELLRHELGPNYLVEVKA
jgi:hypothetical protein